MTYAGLNLQQFPELLVTFLHMQKEQDMLDHNQEIPENHFKKNLAKVNKHMLFRSSRDRLVLI